MIETILLISIALSTWSIVYNVRSIIRLNRRSADDEQRLKYLNKRIAEYPHWGAALTAMDEERRAILRNLKGN